MIKTLSKYDDYRDYLKDLFEAKKKGQKKFSHQYCALRLGTSRSYLKNLMDKHLHMRPEKFGSIFKLFKMDIQERQGFVFLYLLACIKDVELKNYFKKSLKVIEHTQFDKNIKESDLTTYNPFKSSLRMIIDALSKVQGFEMNPQWVKAHILVPAEHDEIEFCLNELQKKMDNTTYGKVRAGDENAFLVYQIGQKLAQEVTKAPYTYKPCHFDMMAVSLNRENSDLVMKKIVKLKNEIMNLAEKDQNPDQVYFISNNFFTVTKSSIKDSDLQKAVYSN